jgi:hypothetical protein
MVHRLSLCTLRRRRGPSSRINFLLTSREAFVIIWLRTCAKASDKGAVMIKEVVIPPVEVARFELSGLQLSGRQHIGCLNGASYTRIEVRLGEMLAVRGQRVDACGIRGWTAADRGRWPFVGPDGYATDFPDGLYADAGPVLWIAEGTAVTGAPLGMLVGVISRYRVEGSMAEGPWRRLFRPGGIAIGSEFHSVRCPINGYLYLMMNDGWANEGYTDNEGSIQIEAFLY